MAENSKGKELTNAMTLSEKYVLFTEKYEANRAINDIVILMKEVSDNDKPTSLDLEKLDDLIRESKAMLDQLLPEEKDLLESFSSFLSYAPGTIVSTVFQSLNHSGYFFIIISQKNQKDTL